MLLTLNGGRLLDIMPYSHSEYVLDNKRRYVPYTNIMALLKNERRFYQNIPTNFSIIFDKMYKGILKNWTHIFLRGDYYAFG